MEYFASLSHMWIVLSLILFHNIEEKNVSLLNLQIWHKENIAWLNLLSVQFWPWMVGIGTKRSSFSLNRNKGLWKSYNLNPFKIRGSGLKCVFHVVFYDKSKNVLTYTNDVAWRWNTHKMFNISVQKHFAAIAWKWRTILFQGKIIH